MTLPSAKLLLIPTIAVLGVTAGAVASAYAFDQVAARYLWPEPEDLIVQQASPTPQKARPTTFEDLQREYTPAIEPAANDTDS